MTTVTPLYTTTRGGRKFVFTNPEGHDYNANDIAHSLSNICRYGGASRYHYSVAQHSVLMAELAYAMTLDPVFALDCLFHDAAEAYIGDLPTPIKVQMPKYRQIEDRIDAALRKHFRAHHIPVPKVQSEACRVLDKAMFLAEWPVLMGYEDCGGWYPDVEPANVVIESWSPEYAKRRFIEVGEYLIQQHHNPTKEGEDNGEA